MGAGDFSTQRCSRGHERQLEIVCFAREDLKEPLEAGVLLAPLTTRQPYTVGCPPSDVRSSIGEVVFCLSSSPLRLTAGRAPFAR